MIIRTEGLEEARYQEPERTDRNSFETFLPFKFARGMSKPSTDPPKPSTGKDINTLKDYNDTIGERIIETPESNLDRWKIAAKIIHPTEDLGGFLATPCVRRSLLLGIGGGFAIGGLRFTFSRNIRSSTNWAIGSFALLAVSAREKCMADQRNQRKKFRQLVEYNREQAKLKASNQPIGPEIPAGTLAQTERTSSTSAESKSKGRMI